MKKVILFMMFFLAGCSSSPRSTTNLYSGKDAGYAVISIRAERFVGVFNVCMRKVDDPRKNKIALIYDNGFVGKNPDFQEGVSSGKIERFSLMPGLYEIYDYKVVSSFNSFPRDMPPTKFEIKAGEITYLGEHYFHDMKSGLMRNVYSTVENERERDMNEVSKRPINMKYTSDQEDKIYFRTLNDTCRNTKQ